MDLAAVVYGIIGVFVLLAFVFEIDIGRRRPKLVNQINNNGTNED
jgi:hypothetical protein